jgi:GDP-4-dehydro-6-deoxy-D-mannose reductase
MRALVTGAGGLIGSHLVKALAARGDLVSAWVRRPSDGEGSPNTEFAVTDINDASTVNQNLRAFSPDVVFHLAGQSSPGASWEDPGATYVTNVIGTINLLEATRRIAKPPRLLLAGSSSEYAEPAESTALPEDAALEPNSPYAASKAAMTSLAQLYERRYQFDIIIARPFFLVGPGKTGDVCSDFARGIVSIERGEQKELRVGTLDVIRDIMDVRDGASALLRLADAGQRGTIYNISSGRGVTIREILDTFRSLARVPLSVTQDPTRLRPLEQHAKIGDPARLVALGWRPAYPLRETLRSILDHWRSEANRTTS